MRRKKGGEVVEKGKDELMQKIVGGLIEGVLGLCGLIFKGMEIEEDTETTMYII
mgnify:CR=1 FL=1